MTDLVNRLMEEKVEDLKPMDYPTLILNSGPPEQIVADAMVQIEPEIIELQGKVISPEM